jgi:hypothetical protein
VFLSVKTNATSAARVNSPTMMKYASQAEAKSFFWH